MLKLLAFVVGPWKCEDLKHCNASSCYADCKERGFNEGGHSFQAVCSINMEKCCCQRLDIMQK
jgi:hypothetical protein